MIFSNPTSLILIVPAILLALTVHEWAHAWTANRLGDPTARLMGRLTLNPLAHLDPVGTILILLTWFGWARPVPVDTRHLRRPKRDLFWIASAGPISNLAQALLLGTVLRLGGEQAVAVGQEFLYTGVVPPGVLNAVFGMAYYGFLINIILAWFNLIPVPPLDGSKIVLRFLSPEATRAYLEFGRFGWIVLLILVFPARAVFWAILTPAIRLTGQILSGIILM
jgi:Zn-dependent protease